MPSSTDDDRAVTVRDIVKLTDLKTPDDAERELLRNEVKRLSARVVALEADNADNRARILVLEAIIGKPRP